MFPYAVDHNNLSCNKQNERIACKDQHMYVCMCVCRACTCTWMLHMRDLECGGHPRAGAKQTLDDKLTCVHASAMAMTN